MTGDPRLVRDQGRLWWVWPDGRRLPRLAGATTFTLTQSQFRGRNDDGSETAATWKAATNTNWTQSYDQVFRVRFTVQANNATGTAVPQLQYNRNGAGFNNVTGASTVVRATASPNITDGVATTQQLTGTGTFAAGSVDEVDGLTANVTLAANGNTEVEYSVLIRSADVVAGDTIVLRVVGQATAGTAFGGTYTSPTVTVAGPQLTDSGTAADSLQVTVQAPLADAGTAADQLVPPPEPPQDVAGLRLWLAARKETGLSGGASVPTPTNWAGLGNTLTQATGTKQPTYQTAVIDSRAVFRFSGPTAGQEWVATTGNLLAVTNAAAGLTVFVVAKRSLTAPTTTEQFLNFDTATVGAARAKFGYRNTGAAPETWYVSGRLLDADGQSNITDAVVVDQSWHLHTVAVDWTNNQISWSREQTSDGTTTGLGAGTTSATNSAQVAVGSKGGAEYLTGDIAEVLIYDRVLNSTDRQTVWTYLAGVYPSLAGTTTITLSDAGTAADVLQPAAQVALAEVGVGTDALAPAAQVLLADAAAAADSVQVAVPRPLADSGAGADSVRVAAAVPLAESGAGTDSASATAQVPLADSGSGADNLAVSQFEPKTLADSGAAADVLQPAATVPLADQAAAADQAVVAAAVVLADSGAGTDSLDSAAAAAATVEIGAVRWVTADLGTPKTLTDSGAGADTLRVTAAVPLTDAGATAETLLPVAAVTLTDSGTTADTLTVGQFEPKTLADAGIGADTLRVAAAVLLADAGAGAEQLQPAAAVLLADSGAAADSLQVNQGIPKPLADSGTASDQPQVAAQVPLPESGQATDILVTDQTRTLTDSAAAADSLTVGQFVPKPLNDSATGADQLLAAAQTPLGDSGTAAETLLPVAQAPLTDSGTAADALVVQQLGDTKTLTDSGIGADTLAVTQSRLLADSGAGSDQLVVVQGRVLTDTGTAADSLRPSALVVLADGATASDVLALAALAALTDSGIGRDALVVLTVARWIRTQSTERPTTTVSREPATATSSREPALATSSREQGGP